MTDKLEEAQKKKEIKQAKAKIKLEKLIKDTKLVPKLKTFGDK